MLETVPNLQDAFVGAELVLHLAKDEPLDEAKLAAALKKHEVKMEGRAKKDAGYLL